MTAMMYNKTNDVDDDDDDDSNSTWDVFIVSYLHVSFFWKVISFYIRHPLILIIAPSETKRTEVRYLWIYFPSQRHQGYALFSLNFFSFYNSFSFLFIHSCVRGNKEVLLTCIFLLFPPADHHRRWTLHSLSVLHPTVAALLHLSSRHLLILNDQSDPHLILGTEDRLTTLIPTLLMMTVKENKSSLRLPATKASLQQQRRGWSKQFPSMLFTLVVTKNSDGEYMD